MLRLKKIICCLESIWFLTQAKFQVVFLPYAQWRFRDAYFQCETLQEDVSHFRAEIRLIQKCILWIGRRLPWKSKCLDQAMAMQKMLQRRGLPVTLYLGMLKNEQQEWNAHAWVRCGNLWTVGHQPMMNYTVVGSYAWIPQQ